MVLVINLSTSRLEIREIREFKREIFERERKRETTNKHTLHYSGIPLLHKTICLRVPRHRPCRHPHTNYNLIDLGCYGIVTLVSFLAGVFYLEERTDQYWRTRLTKSERQRRIATADIALHVPDSNGSCVERWLELRSCIFVYRSLNFFSTK